jgi:hypothetical protein
MAVIAYTMLAHENGRFTHFKVHGIVIHTYTSALLYTLLVFLNKWA